LLCDKVMSGLSRVAQQFLTFSGYGEAIRWMSQYV
jgi:hypothetical protein